MAANVYYNEIDPFAAAWLRELIKAGVIAPGVVDERSIEDVTPNDIKDFTQCHFFAGLGTWSYALRQAGWSDDRPVWTGSCPCQPFSTAGKGKGASDERHLWPAWFHLIEQRKPGVILGEQVESAVRHLWSDLVQEDLEANNYAVGTLSVPAHAFGADHKRQRLYFCAVGDTEHNGPHSFAEHGCPAKAVLHGTQGKNGAGQPAGTGAYGLLSKHPGKDAEYFTGGDGRRRRIEPGTSPLAHGAAARVGRIRGYGNGMYAPLAIAFIESVMEVIDE